MIRPTAVWTAMVLATALLSAPAAPVPAVIGTAPAASAAPVTGPLRMELPGPAVSGAVSYATAHGSTLYLSVVDRRTGGAVARTANSTTQVASESIMKLMLATYYLTLYGGYQSTPAEVRSQLSYMLRYSDDATANQLFSANAIPTVAQRYGMRSTTNATDRVGHWGAARITASDMTTFLYRASTDPAVGPWLIPVMAQTTALGSDGFNQAFGLNALSGVHGSKQGWGCDSFWLGQQCGIHSVGYTDRYFVAVLQTSTPYPDPMRATSTYAAKRIQASNTPPPPLRDGDFVLDTRSGTIYRMVGGAPIVVTNWASVGGSKPYRRLTGPEFDALRQYPAEGTFMTAGGTVYRVAGGAPVAVTKWSSVGGARPTVVVDPAAISRAGTGPAYNHLRYRPVDGTFVSGGSFIYRIAGGAPIYVGSWSAFGGVKPYIPLDPVAISTIRPTGPFSHLLQYPADGTFVTAAGTVYRIAGGAPIVVTNWASMGGSRPSTTIDPTAVNRAGSAAPYHHLRYRPADGTFVSGGSYIYKIAGGAPLYVNDWASVGGPQPYTGIDPAAISTVRPTGPYSHLNFYPADGTFLRGEPGGKVYRVNDGVPVDVPSWDPYGGPQPTVTVSQATIDHRGGPAPRDHLRAG